MMKNVIFLGPPGCGKGTQAALLTAKLDYVKVSTGDLLREMAKQDNDLARKIHDILSQGILVSNEIVNQLIERFYAENKNTKGVILDGYPRCLEQAKSLELILKNSNNKVSKVFYFDIAEDILVKRITGRYICNKCGAIYNSFFHNTELPGICDKCHSTDFNKRSDDSKEIIIERLQVFKNLTKPLLEYYSNKLIKVDAEQSVKLILNQVIKSLVD